MLWLRGAATGGGHTLHRAPIARLCRAMLRGSRPDSVPNPKARASQRASSARWPGLSGSDAGAPKGAGGGLGVRTRTPHPRLADRVLFPVERRRALPLKGAGPDRQDDGRAHAPGATATRFSSRRREKRGDGALGGVLAAAKRRSRVRARRGFSPDAAASQRRAKGV